MKALRKIRAITIVLALVSLFSLLTSCQGEDIEGGVIYNGKWVTGCEAGITSAKIREGTVGIQTGAFSGQASLMEITIPNSVTTVMSGAFSGCDALITKEGGISYVSDWVIEADKTIQEANVKDGTKGIASRAFYGCEQLKCANIPKSAGSIGKDSFAGCSAIEEITLPFLGATENSTLNSHFAYIFGASNQDKNSEFTPRTLKRVTLTATAAIDDGAFFGCSSIAEINLPDTLVSIGKDAFRGCASLNRVNVPDTVKHIGEYAFYACHGLLDVNIPSGIEILEKFTFTECKSLTKITVPDSVTIIEPCVFGNCENLVDVTLSKNLVSIGQQAFDGCNLMTDIYIPSGNIGKGVFNECENLTNVTLGDGIEIIGENAFYSCRRLTNINAPAALKEIKAQAFANCNSLVAFNMTEGLEEIGEYAFYYCSSLSGIKIPESVTSVGAQAFRACDGTVSRSENGVEAVDGWITYALPAATYLVIDSSIRGIAKNVLIDCNGFDTVYLGDGADLTEITVCSGNGRLYSAAKYTFSENLPESEGKFWHYTDGIPTRW